MKMIARFLLVACMVCGVPANGRAQVSTPDLGRATLEELMNLRVTSPSRKQQCAEDVPAAVYVITQEDIRRSGLTTLPEIFRLVPGMQVARINANKWAISLRGFNDLHSNKLLVLIDGRSVYNRVFSGVLWDGQDVLISDIDRIEVVRGPGGSVWGANAVNGIINIITRPAAETKGTVVEVSIGTLERDRITARYGGSLGNLAYRVYSQWSEYADALSTAGTRAGDRWNSLGAGFRADWANDGNEVMAQGNFMDSLSRPNWLALPNALPGAVPSPGKPTDVDEVNVLGRWTHTRPNGAALTVQASHSNTYRDDSLAWTRERTDDVDVQYQAAVGLRHDIVFGGGVRDASLSVRGTFTLAIDPDDNSVFNAFVQDDITLGRRVSVMLGSKLEHDTTAAWGLLPSARIMWQASTSQRLWGAISRARRTPSTTDRAMRVHTAVMPGDPLPILVGFLGNPNFRSEQLLQTEVGYRLRVGSTAEVDVTAFHGQYDDLETAEPLTPVLELTPAPAHLFVGAQASNMLKVDTMGLEVNGRWEPFKAWRLDGSYSLLHVTPHPDPMSRDINVASFDGHAPRHQWQLHSSTWLTPRAQFDAAFYHVGRLHDLDVAAYSRTDARFAFKLTNRVSAIATGQNLFRAAHQEFSGIYTLLVSSNIPRSARVQLRWQF